MNHQLLCVFLLIFAIGCRDVDRRAFQSVERASTTVQTALDNKATLAQFRPLLAAYSAEVSAAESRASTPGERRLLAEYQAALKALTDVQLVWEEKEARGVQLLPIREALPARLKREYDLPVNTNEPPSIYADEAMTAAWDAARQHMRAASAALAR